MRALIVAGAIAGIFFNGPALASTSMEVQRQGNVSYVSGGVGDDAKAAIESISKDFNLQVTLANPAGEYLGGARVAVRDMAGKSVLDADSQGPLFLAELAPGKYTVTVSDQGHESEKRTVEVPQHGRAALVFHLPEEGTRTIR